MTDPLARLRAEINADIANRLKFVAIEQKCIDALSDVLDRIIRIEAEFPVPAVPEAPAGRAPRRNLQAAVLTAVDNDPRGLTAAQVRELAGRLVGEITESACNRTLRTLVDAGKLILSGGHYRLPPEDTAEEDTARRVPRAVDAAAE